jgi:hypothetical protein
MNKDKISTPTRKLNSLSIEQKDEIIRYHKSHPHTTQKALALQARYRAKVVRILLKTLDETGKVLTIDIKQAIYFFREAWREVCASQTIENCWRKSKIADCSNISECIEKIREEREQVIENVLSLAHLKKLFDFKNFYN